MALDALVSFLIAVGLPLWLAAAELVHQARVWGTEGPRVTISERRSL
jgi:hypothetical protein